MPYLEHAAPITTSSMAARSISLQHYLPNVSLTPRSQISSSCGTPPSSKLSPAISNDHLAQFANVATIDYRKLYELEIGENQKSRNELLDMRRQLDDALEKLEQLEQREREHLVSSAALDRRERRNLESKVAEYEERLKDYVQMRDEMARLKEENTKLICLISQISRSSSQDQEDQVYEC